MADIKRLTNENIEKSRHLEEAEKKVKILEE